MLTVDDKRIHFCREYEPVEDPDDEAPPPWAGTSKFRFRVWVGDSDWDPAGICVWACSPYGDNKEELLQSAVDLLNRLIKEKLEFLKGFVNE